MGRWAGWFGAALIAAAVWAPAQAQTTTATPTLHARARHHPKHHVVSREREGRQITVHKSATNATPSWLTLGNDGAPVGSGNNYVTSTFDQPSAVQGTISGYRGQERLIDRYGVPGASLFQF